MSGGVPWLSSDRARPDVPPSAKRWFQFHDRYRKWISIFRDVSEGRKALCCVIDMVE